MPLQDPERPYTQPDVRNMLDQRLPAGKHTWLRDPEGNPAVQADQADVPAFAAGLSRLPAQRRPDAGALYAAADLAVARGRAVAGRRGGARPAARVREHRASRERGTTQETERDEQWVVTIPERLSEAGYAALESFVTLVASCMGVDR